MWKNGNRFSARSYSKYLPCERKNMYKNAKIYSDGSHYVAILQQKSNIRSHSSFPYSPEREKTKELFETAFQENRSKHRKEKFKSIEDLSESFSTQTETESFVRENMERKRRNELLRKTRLARKVAILLDNETRCCSAQHNLNSDRKEKQRH